MNRLHVVADVLYCVISNYNLTN